MFVRASANSGGKVYVQHGISSNEIICGFRASKVYVSDPNYNTTHKVIQCFDYAISPTTYTQNYDDVASIISNTGAFPFVMLLGDTSVTLNSSFTSLCSANAVVMVCA